MDARNRILTRFLPILIAAVSVFVGTRMESNYAPGFYSSDIDIYSKILERMESEFLYLHSVEPVRNIQKDPESSNWLNHNVYVRGPKIVFYSLAFFFGKSLRYFQSAATWNHCLFLFSLLCAGWSSFLLSIWAPPEQRSLRVYLASSFGCVFFPPMNYYLFSVPNYVHLSIAFLLSSLTLMRTRRSSLSILGAGVLGGLLVGVSPSAPFLILAVGFYPLLTQPFTQAKRDFLLFFLGTVSAIGALELLAPASHIGFLRWFFAHLGENLHQNHLGQPFPYNPLHLLGTALFISPVLTLITAFYFLSYRRLSASAFHPVIVALGWAFLSLCCMPTVPLLRVMTPIFAPLTLTSLLAFLAVRNKWRVPVTITLICAIFIYGEQTKQLIKMRRTSQISLNDRLDVEETIYEFFYKSR